MNSTIKRRSTGELAGINDPRWAGQVFTVTKVNPTTYQLTPVNGGRPVRVPHEMTIDATEHGTAQDVPVGQSFQEQVYWSPGTLVRWKARKAVAGLSYGDIGVVLADKGRRVNVAKLGGNRDQYARAPHALLEVMDPADVLR